jgi:hypothetical protein
MRGSRTIWTTGLPLKRGLLGLLAGALTMKAQSVIAPVPSAAAPPPELRAPENTGNQAVPPAEAAAGTLQETSPFQWGPATFYPHLFYRFLYGDGIQANPGQEVTSAVHLLSPGILTDIGTHWTLDYTPTWTLYSNRQLQNTLDHAVNLAGATSFQDWLLKFSQSYNYANDPLIATGSQTTQQSASTAFTASYRFGNRMRLDSTLSQNLQFTQGFSDSRAWDDLEQFHYQFSKYLDTFAGLDLGYEEQSNSPDMESISPTLGIACHPTDKISLNANAGLESRRFLSGSAANVTTPVYGASLGYQPVSTTKLTVGANREVDTSALEDQITKTTTLNADLNQRLLQNFYLDVSFEHQAVDYVSSVGSPGLDREDKLYTVNVKLSTTFFGRGTIAVFFQNSHNASTSAEFAFTSHQGGVEIGYRY